VTLDFNKYLNDSVKLYAKKVDKNGESIDNIKELDSDFKWMVKI